MKLTREFYGRTSLEVARDLLGHLLVHVVDGIPLVARIVETEAYMGAIDKAAHSYNNKRTNRTEVMFGPAGHAYVYLIYGMYSCMNVVAAEVGTPQAVLIRALEPVEGLEKMVDLRYGKPLSACTHRELVGLTSGPGKLCRALGITRQDTGADLCGDKLYILQGAPVEDSDVVETTRINIDYAEEAIDFPWRFYIKGNPYVSKK